MGCYWDAIGVQMTQTQKSMNPERTHTARRSLSNLSNSNIKDLSSCIGFTRIGPRIKDLGPCFRILDLVLARIGILDPRRDTDMISRLSKSTIDFLSCHIGFGSLSNIKMTVFDENISVVRFFYRKIELFFDFLF